MSDLPMAEWKSELVIKFLKQFPFCTQLIAYCQENKPDGTFIDALDHEILKEIGMLNPLHRFQLLTKIRDIKKKYIPRNE
jgi:hypothetical protein